MEILIADKNYELIEYVRLTLNRYLPDWDVSVVNSDKECLDIVVSDSCPDIVIIGTGLTDMNGLDLIEQIRDDSNVTIIILSDDSDMNKLVKAFDVGANDYIVKPFNKAIFIARLKALVRRRIWDIPVSKYPTALRLGY
jgi:two-component system KDP operon response regulator KdpE